MSVPYRRFVPGSVPTVDRSPTALDVRQGTPPVVPLPRIAHSAAATTPGAPTAGPGLVGSLLYRLGFVPKSEYAPLTTEAAQLQSQLASLNASNASLLSQAQSLEGQISSARSTLAGLQDTEANLKSQYQSLLSQLASLQSAVSGLTSKLQFDQSTLSNLRSAVATLQSEINGDNATIGTLKLEISSSASRISSLQGQVSSLTSQVDAYAKGITGVAAGPLANARSDPFTDTVAAYPNGMSDSDLGLSGGDVGQMQTDLGQSPTGKIQAEPSYSWAGSTPFAYAPATVGFDAGYAGLSTASGGVLKDARPSFQALGPSGAAVGSRLAGAIGYVPVGQVSSEQEQISSLQSQVSAAQSTNTQLQSRVASDQSTLGGLNGQIASAKSSVGTLDQQIASVRSAIAGQQSQEGTLNSEISSTESQIATLRTQQSQLSATHSSNLTTISSLTLQFNANLSTISSLNAQVSPLQQELAAWKAGGFPVTFSWSMGTVVSSSGTGGPTPSALYSDAAGGRIGPSLTISVTTPDGTVHSRTFQLPNVLLGQWPSQVNLSGGGATSSGTVNAQFLDAAGSPIAGMRVWYIARNAVGGVIAHGISTTDGNGYARYNYYGAGTVRVVAVRNPRVNGKSGLATL